VEGVAGLGGAPARSMKRLPQVGDLGWTAGLQALVDRPGITAGFGDQCRDAYVAELHRTGRGFAALRSSISAKSLAAQCTLRPRDSLALACSTCLPTTTATPSSPRDNRTTPHLAVNS